MGSRDRASVLRGQVSIWGALATPAIVVLTGAMYLAGWTEQNTVLDRFGLTSDHFAPSFQAILARGYLLVLIIAAASALALFVLWAIISGGEERAGTSHPVISAVLSATNGFLRVNFYFVAGLLVLAGSSIGARQFGTWRAEGVRETVDGGCARFCFVYLAAGRRVIGRLIEEDAQHMAVYTRGGIALLDNADLLAVLPYRPGMRLPAVPDQRRRAVSSGSDVTG
jgi:hypothetical protein